MGDQGLHKVAGVGEEPWTQWGEGREGASADSRVT